MKINLEEYNLKELIELKNNLKHQICIKEFEERGFKKILDDLNKPYRLFSRNPLGKNILWQVTIGIPKLEFDFLINKKTLIIIGLMDSRKVDSHIYYVVDGMKNGGGYTSEHEYIDIKRKNNNTNRWEVLLPTIEEYLKNEL